MKKICPVLICSTNFRKRLGKDGGFFPRGANYENLFIVKCFHAYKEYKLLGLEEEADVVGRN